jgi:hypothetical protein
MFRAGSVGSAMRSIMARKAMAAIGVPVLGKEFEGSKEDAADAPLDEIVAEFLGVFEAGVGIAMGLSGCTPKDAEVLDAREAGKFAADEFEDFGVTKAGNEETELADGRSGGLGMRADECS